MKFFHHMHLHLKEINSFFLGDDEIPFILNNIEKIESFHYVHGLKTFMGTMIFNNVFNNM